MNDHDRIVRIREQIRAQDKALGLASQTLDERVSRLNEFRAALADAQATMMPRNEARLLIEALEGRIRILETSASTSGGRTAGVQWIVATLLLAAGLVVAVVVALNS